MRYTAPSVQTPGRAVTTGRGVTEEQNGVATQLVTLPRLCWLTPTPWPPLLLSTRRVLLRQESSSFVSWPLALAQRERPQGHC